MDTYYTPANVFVHTYISVEVSCVSACICVHLQIDVCVCKVFTEYQTC